MPTTTLGLPYPSAASTVNVPGDIQALAAATDARMPVLSKSWKTTPALLGVTTEVDVLSNSWTPAIVGCYRFEAVVPFDGSAGGTDCKAHIYIGGVEREYDVRATPGGGFVGKLRMNGTVDISSLAAVTVKTTFERIAGAAVVNSRIVEARIELFYAGLTGVRA